MVERFFFDRVDAKATGQSIAQQTYFVSDSAADKTEAALSVIQLAKARAQVALEFAIFQRVPVTRTAAMVSIHDQNSDRPLY